MQNVRIQKINFFFKIKYLYIYWHLKLQYIKQLNCSLSNIINNILICICICISSILYQYEYIFFITKNISEKIIEWSNVAGINIRLVTLSNRHYANEKDIRVALDIKIGDPLLKFDIYAAKMRIESIDWVQVANIRRVFPDILNISIIEHVPFAIWQIKGKHKLIDKNGILITNKVLFRDYKLFPLIVGKGAEKKALYLLNILKKHLKILKHIKAIILVGERRWDLDMKNGIQVLLPSFEPESVFLDLEYMILYQNIFKRGINIIDFRLKDRVRFQMDDITAEKYFKIKKYQKKSN